MSISLLDIFLFLDTFICYNHLNNFEGGALMGLIDREYMNRTPEERMADKSPELKKFRDRQEEMHALHAKGNSLTPKERRRLEEIYELNRQYMNTGKTNEDLARSKFSSVKQSPPPAKPRKKHKYLPVLIFVLVVLPFLFVLTYYPWLLGV